MEAKVVAQKLRRQLAAAGLPAQSPRLKALFDALHKCPSAEVPALAKLASSVVEALIDPQRRDAMWAKVDSLSPGGWRNLAAKQSTRSGGGSRRTPQASPGGERERRVRTALLGILGQAVQGAGHLQLELERQLKEGATAANSPVWDLLRRLRSALSDAEKQHRAATSALAHVAGQVLAVVEEHPNRIGELVSAFKGAGTDELRHLAVRMQSRREHERDRREALIGDLGLAVVDSDALEEIVARIVSLPVFRSFWQERERAAAQSLLVHLRQGEQLRGAENVVALGDRTSTNKQRHVRAYARASHLIAQLLLTDRKEKTPVWWDRIVQSSLREIEIDSLGAKRFRAGAQQRMAAKALQALPTATAEDGTTTKLTALIRQLEGQLAERPGDPNLKLKITKTKDLLAKHQATQKARARQQLARLAQEQAHTADPSEDWLSGMD